VPSYSGGLPSESTSRDDGVFTAEAIVVAVALMDLLITGLAACIVDDDFSLDLFSLTLGDVEFDFNFGNKMYAVPTISSGSKNRDNDTGPSSIAYESPKKNRNKNKNH
jgi:hypothetical protein